MAISASDFANAMSAKFTQGGIPVAASQILDGTEDPNVLDVIRQIYLQMSRWDFVMPSIPRMP